MIHKKITFLLILIPNLCLILPVINVYADEFKFVVISDTQGSDGNGVNSAILEEIVQETIDEQADFVLVSGDLVDGTIGQSSLESQLLHWRDVMQPVYDANIGVYPVRGNHDSGDKSVWDGVFSGAYILPDNGPVDENNVTYSFIHENTLIIGLDQYTNPHRINQTWLQEQLLSNSQPHVFVFGHEPAFKLKHDDCLDDYPNQRDSFWASLVESGARTYFCGHDHCYDHARIDDGDGNSNNDIHQIITVSGGELFYDGIYDGNNTKWRPLQIDHEDIHQGRQGYMLVEVEGPNATLYWKYRSAPNSFEVGDIFSYTTTPVSAPNINFTDPNLQAAVEDQLGITEPNTDDILSLTFLDVNSKGITDLEGLEY
ncbi:MAG: metallophosphoesterase family protein, partial [Planctomycetota bacterium]